MTGVQTCALPIYVGSQVASDEAAITQLRALLKDAGNVSGLLSVQDQINSEESDLEAMLAQQQALSHETAFATVTLTILGPKAPAKAKAKHKHVPPPGLASGLKKLGQPQCESNFSVLRNSSVPQARQR